MHPAARRAIPLICALALLPWVIHALPSASSAQGFASEVERLSEPEGSFDTDNLISNERGYLQILSQLNGVAGGAYVGVGPDQNFSYIVRVRPSVAYIIDIRRDNLLLHLLFKALFARSSTRIEYLSLLTGRAPPPQLDRWKRATIAQIAEEVDAQRADPDKVAALDADLHKTLMGYGVSLSPADLRTIDRFHKAFVEGGLGLQFQSFGRLPQLYYPTFRDLLLATDSSGRQRNYLAAEEDFQFLKALEGRDGVIPVVGDVSGPHAMQAIAGAIRERSTHVSAMYVSNIENYLSRRDGSMSRFIENVRAFPREPHSVIIRSIFGSAGASVQMVEPLESLFVAAPAVRSRQP